MTSATERPRGVDADERVGDAARPLDVAWRHALELLLDDLQRRDVAPRTRRAYRVDLEQFARWASARASAPREVDSKLVRRYVADLSERGAAPSTSARKLAAIRALFSSQREHGEIAENPADLVLADLRMPGTDGSALLARLPAAIPVIVITSADAPPPPGAAAMLRKDELTMERLVFTIRGVLGGAR